MSNKDLHNIIRTSMLALVNPQMAEACITANLSAGQFESLHKSLTGETVSTSTEASQDDSGEMEKLLLSIPNQSH